MGCEGCARVDDAPLGGDDGRSTHLDIVQNHLPVASDTWHHLNDWDVVEVSSVSRWVGTSKGELTCGTSGCKEDSVSCNRRLVRQVLLYY